MPETPKEKGRVVDKILQQLNSDWDLQLPRLHGKAAEAAESTSAIAKKCSARIRYLCFRHDDPERLVEDFDGTARRMYGQWRFKPRQEKGTLPVLPVKKSGLAKDVVKKRSLGLVRLSPSQRQDLLRLLDRTLEDDYRLARDSDSFSVTPAPTTSAPASISGSTPTVELTPPTSRSRPEARRPPASETVFATARKTAGPVDRPIVREWPQMAKKRATETKLEGKAKRGKTSNEGQSGQQRLTGFLSRPDISVQHATSEATHMSSFETTISPAPSEIFDKSNSRSGTSSADTTILESDDEINVTAAELPKPHPLKKHILNRQAETTSFSTTSFPTELEDVFQFPAPRLPPGLPFDILYELHSLALSWDVDILGLYKALQNICKTEIPAAARRWQAIKELGQGMLPHEVFGPNSWNPARNAIPGKESHKSIYLRARLTWAKPKEGRLFRPQMLAPLIDKSCRFHRAFGGTRFLELQVPFLRAGDIKDDSRHLKNHAQSISQAVIQWLSSRPLQIAGRSWRSFFVDDSPFIDTDGVYYSRVHFFAVGGVGIVARNDPGERPICHSMTIEDFIDWHAPIRYNIGSTDLKLFARFKLGLSKTIPTVILERTEFIKVSDIIGSDGQSVMNDGCALMSLELAREVTYRLKLDEVPSAFQGRIGGAKGLWLVERSNCRPMINAKNNWIEVSDSQLKIKPHPVERDACQEARTFEVTSWSHPLRPAALNTQLVTVLKDRGVPRKALEDCVLAQSNLYLQELSAGMADSRALRAFEQKYHKISRVEDEIPLLGSFPDGTAERASQLLDAGFTPSTCSYLVELHETLLKKYYDIHLERMKIYVNETTTAYCAPDPYGVLEEGEVHLGFSQIWTYGSTSEQRMFLTDIDGLVARNPANLPSDIQKIRFVFRERLSSLTDVIFFSTQGPRSLASLLSGGDYDGDKAWVCWHEPFVRAFINDRTGPPDHYTPEDCSLIRRSRKLSETAGFASGRAENADHFLHAAISFNLIPSLLGRCTKEHVRLVYQIGLRQSRSKKLAALLSYLVDARKQGYELPPAAWYVLRRECSGPAELPKPAFEAGDESTLKEKDPARMNINDFLRFAVARKEIVRAKTLFRDKFPRGSTYDKDLSMVYTRCVERAEREKVAGDITLDSFLKALKENIKRVHVEWQQRSSRSEADDKSFVTAVEACHQSFKGIQPCLLGQHYIFQRIEEDRDEALSYWDLLKASCFHCFFPGITLTWLMAGHELCFLKAKTSNANVNVMTRSMYAVTKIDAGAVKKHLAIRDEETEADDEPGPLAGTIDAYI